MMGGGFGGFGMGLGGPLMILFWILVIAAVVAVVAGLARQLPGRGGARGGDGDDRALEILRERYARGEIDHDEFERQRRDLDG